MVAGTKIWRKYMAMEAGTRHRARHIKDGEEMTAK
jgi:hypothetical protein